MRDQLLRAVMARLDRIKAARDPALVLEPGALDDAQRLAEALRDDDGDLEACYVLGWFHWYRCLVLPQGRHYEALEEASRALTPCFIAGVEGLPEPLLSSLASNATGTAVTLLKQAMSGSDLNLITTTVSLWQRVLTAIPADHHDRVAMLSNLGLALQLRFERVGALADLDEAITVGRAAAQTAPADHPDRAGYLSNLSGALRVRFGRVGMLTDLDEAITVARAAVRAAPADHPDQAATLSNLGGALQARFGRMGALADLDEAVTVIREAVQATLADHPDRAATLSNLGLVLRVRFGRVGAQADLDEAITVGRAAVQATPADHPHVARRLSNLGVALRARFERVGAQADLDEAITVGWGAVQATPADHPDRAGYLSNLGFALRVRFRRVGAQADLDQAITVGREAVQATPADHPDRAGHMSNLSLVLQVRFEQVGTQEDLDEAITLGRAATQATPADHPNRAVMQSSLGGALRLRFERVGAQEDLDDAITVGRGAVQTTPADHPHRASYLSNLGLVLQFRFQRAGAQEDLDEAIATFTQAAGVESGAPSVRIRAARVGASLAAQTETRGVADLLEAAVRLLPETAPRQLNRGDQQYALGRFAELASDAATLALLSEETDPSGANPATRALRLLELGRGVMLSQALDTRSDLTDLQARHPALAARFIELRDQLDQAGDTSVLTDDGGMAAAWGEHRVKDRHHLAAAFESTAAEIRDMDGFETFLLPPEPDQLIRHAQGGPVVVVNVSRYRSDAILLTPEAITSVPLPNLAHDALIGRIISFHQALGTAHDPEVSSDQRRGAQDTLNVTLEWLWDAAAKPIFDELGYRRTPVPGTAWSRVWWAPGGLLGFLPLHAAGYHRERPGPGDSRRTVMDRVISSYTPTVRALGYARERNTTLPAGERALIVAMPTTPGIDSPLRHVTKEAELVHARLPCSTLLIEDPDATTTHLPTRATVLAQLNGCAIAHFACHGSSHPVDPSQNLLLLHDHDTDPLTVISLAPIRLERARLAYLSACRTAFNSSTDLIDEAIHLTTAFQLAGYPHVVGTLWEIDDALAVRVADTFYTALTTGPDTIDTRGAAQALHHAVRAIRDELPATPSLWAAYLHAGA